MSILSTSKPPRALQRPAGSGVPWATVVTLALGMSCTAAFWLVSLAGAVGAPERFETPFATWAMLSLTLLPVFGVGVLGALMLARRWFGPVLRWPGPVLATAVLVLATGTLVGVAAIVASSAYDYSLQLPHIGSAMAGMARCTGSCIPREQHAVFALHVHGVALVSQKLLLTNAVLVAWMVAIWGGQIKVSSGPVRQPGIGSDAATGDLADVVRRLLAGALVGTAVIHAAVIPEHLDVWALAGFFFLALSAAEVVVAGLVLARRYERAALLAAGLLSVVPLALWLWSRTTGLPFGPEAGVAESVGLADVLACVLEGVALLAVLALREPGRLARPAPSAQARSLVALSLISVVAVGFVATGPAWFDAFGVAASHSSSMEMSP